MDYRLNALTRDPTLLDFLAEHKILTASQLLRKVLQDPSFPYQASKESKANLEGILILIAKCELVRVRGIGPRRAELLQRAGIDRLRTLREVSPQELITKVRQIGGKISETRAVRIIEQAQELPLEAPSEEDRAEEQRLFRKAILRSEANSVGYALLWAIAMALVYVLGPHLATSHVEGAASERVEELIPMMRSAIRALIGYIIAPISSITVLSLATPLLRVPTVSLLHRWFLKKYGAEYTVAQAYLAAKSIKGSRCLWRWGTLALVIFFAWSLGVLIASSLRPRESEAGLDIERIFTRVISGKANLEPIIFLVIVTCLLSGTVGYMLYTALRGYRGRLAKVLQPVVKEAVAGLLFVSMLVLVICFGGSALMNCISHAVWWRHVVPTLSSVDAELQRLGWYDDVEEHESLLVRFSGLPKTMSLVAEVIQVMGVLLFDACLLSTMAVATFVLVIFHNRRGRLVPMLAVVAGSIIIPIAIQLMIAKSLQGIDIGWFISMSSLLAGAVLGFLWI